MNGCACVSRSTIAAGIPSAVNFCTASLVFSSSTVCSWPTRWFSFFQSGLSWPISAWASAKFSLMSRNCAALRAVSSAKLGFASPGRPFLFRHVVAERLDLHKLHRRDRLGKRPRIDPPGVQIIGDHVERLDVELVQVNRGLHGVLPFLFERFRGMGTAGRASPFTSASSTRSRRPLLEVATAVSGTSSMGAAFVSASGDFHRMLAVGAAAAPGRLRRRRHRGGAEPRPRPAQERRQMGQRQQHGRSRQQPQQHVARPHRCVLEKTGRLLPLRAGQRAGIMLEARGRLEPVLGLQPVIERLRAVQQVSPPENPQPRRMPA